MQEIEVKILEINKDKLIEKLVNLGAEKVFDSEIYAEFYHSLNGEKIRLRKTNIGNFMTLKVKKNLDGVKSNREYETNFGDYETFVNILLISGFQKFGISKKYRVSYKLGNIIFDFDSIENIPDFVEVESDNIKDVEKGVELLGYSMKDTSTFGEKELKAHYNIEWGI
ncbi:MAG: class IV adenylate cyclase [Candidatus Gracilibacteria bacterium]|nr:class IV adenylate cyclase [Candidatus Gracilibacteria bacterium]